MLAHQERDGDLVGLLHAPIAAIGPRRVHLHTGVSREHMGSWTENRVATAPAISTRRRPGLRSQARPGDRAQLCLARCLAACPRIGSPAVPRRAARKTSRTRRARLVALKRWEGPQKLGCQHNRAARARPRRAASDGSAASPLGRKASPKHKPEMLSMPAGSEPGIQHSLTSSQLLRREPHFHVEGDPNSANDRNSVVVATSKIPHPVSEFQATSYR